MTTDPGARSGARQVLFVQGGGAGTHDDWDAALVESLRTELGPGYRVRYPRMPQEGEPSYARWSAVIDRELAGLDEGAVVIGHSVGGTILVQTLVEHAPEQAPVLIVLLAAPFVGEGGWPGTEFAFDADLGGRLPAGVPVHLFHGLRDEVVPHAHADLYARAIPSSHVHRLPGRDHQLDGDLGDVARVIRAQVPVGSGD